MFEKNKTKRLNDIQLTSLYQKWPTALGDEEANTFKHKRVSLKADFINKNEQNNNNQQKIPQESIHRSNYTNTRHFFNIMSQELCYQTARFNFNFSQITKSNLNSLIPGAESNSRNQQILPSIESSRNSGTQQIKNQRFHSLNPPNEPKEQQQLVDNLPISINFSKKKRHNVMTIDENTIHQSVYQLHLDEEIIEEINKKQTLEQVQRTLLMSRQTESDNISDEEANYLRVGFPAVQNYYQKYKSLDKSVEKKKNQRQAPVAYLKQCEEQRIIPQPLGMVSMKGNNEVMNLKSFRVGNQYAQSIGKGLQLSKAIKKINLASNRLSPTGGLKILQGINQGIQEIDLSNNSLGTYLPRKEQKQNNDVNFIDQLSTILTDRKIHLQLLNLDANKLNDAHVQVICDALIITSNKSLRLLSLSENQISDLGCKFIAELLEINSTNIKELKLNWNSIKAIGGMFLANSLKENNHLRVLDLGWNNCGSGSSNEIKVGFIWGDSLQQNKTLQHLDLSFNQIQKHDVEVFQEKLKQNHTIYGIHFQGNEGRIDSLGFLRYKIKSDQSPRDQILNSKIESIQVQRRKNKSVQVTQKAVYGQQTKINFNDENCCWICEGWLENYFKLDLKNTIYSDLEMTDNIKDDHYNVFIHFDFDNWDGDLLEDQRNVSFVHKGKFQQFRMVPQGISYYFYSFEGRPFINMNEKKIQIDEYYRKQLWKDLLHTNQNSRFQTVILNFNLEFLNFIDSQLPINEIKIEKPRLPKISITERESKQQLQVQQKHLVISHDYQVLLKHCIPRMDKILMNTSHIRVRTPWNMEVSLFKDYLKEDKEDLWINCFEFDWQNMKQLKYKQSSEAEVKALMKTCYPLIKEHYKVQAGFGMIGNVFSIALNQYTEFIKEELKLIDGEHLNQADADRYFITVNANKRGPFIPANALVRCQFMEILIRLSVKRYFESQQAVNEAQAIQLLIQNHLNPCSEHLIKAQQWRRKELWNEKCDNILKAYFPVFNHVYNNFGGTHRKPGQKMFMTVDEFENFVISVPLVNDLFGQRDSSVAFNLGMMTQINELDQDRHLCATFIEFLEAFCRVADKAAFEPLNQVVQEGDEQKQLSIEERQKQPLYVKIENTLPYIMKNCCKRPFIDKQFDQPERDKEVGLFVLSNGKYF